MKLLMEVTEGEGREQIVEVGKLMYAKGWVAANDGNISVRLPNGLLLSTPTGISKGMMRPEDLILCDRHGRKMHGSRECTSEILMHLTIYDMRSDVSAIVHAHPPVATGFAVAGRPLNLALLPEVIIGLGSVPLADYGLPGTSELSEALKPFIPTYDAVLMANHGAVCYGEDLQKAFFRMETLEHFARISLVAELLGGPRVLPRAEVEKLLESRGRYGVKLRAGCDPGSALTAEDAPVHELRAPVSRGEVLTLIEEMLRTRN